MYKFVTMNSLVSFLMETVDNQMRIESESEEDITYYDNGDKIIISLVNETVEAYLTPSDDVNHSYVSFFA